LASASGQAPSPNVTGALGSIRTMVLVALIFAIIAMILELIAVIACGLRRRCDVQAGHRKPGGKR